jgi:hypothetical protein
LSAFDVFLRSVYKGARKTPPERRRQDNIKNVLYCCVSNTKKKTDKRKERGDVFVDKEHNNTIGAVRDNKGRRQVGEGETNKKEKKDVAQCFLLVLLDP